MIFYELQGEGARGTLEAFAHSLGAGAETELLESTTQPGLFLLLCRGDAPADAPLSNTQVPAGTKVWQFRAVR